MQTQFSNEAADRRYNYFSKMALASFFNQLNKIQHAGTSLTVKVSDEPFQLDNTILSADISRSQKDKNNENPISHIKFNIYEDTSRSLSDARRHSYSIKGVLNAAFTRQQDNSPSSEDQKYQYRTNCIFGFSLEIANALSRIAPELNKEVSPLIEELYRNIDDHRQELDSTVISYRQP